MLRHRIMGLTIMEMLKSANVEGKVDNCTVKLR